jgi:hypothetical protein
MLAFVLTEKSSYYARLNRYATGFGRDAFSQAIVTGSRTLADVRLVLPSTVAPHLVNTATRFIDEVFLPAVGLKADYWPEELG